MLLRSSILTWLLGFLAACLSASCALTATPTHELHWQPVAPEPTSQSACEDLEESAS